MAFSALLAENIPSICRNSKIIAALDAEIEAVNLRIRYSLSLPNGWQQDCGEQGKEGRQLTSGDLNSFVSEFNLDSEPPTNGFHELAQRVDLGPFDVAVFDPRNAVLAHLEPLGQLDLGKMGSLAKLTESISTNLIEHPLLVRINCLPVGRTFHQHILKHLSHLGKEEWAQDEEGIAEGLVETGVVRAHLREPLEAMAAFHERLMDETANVPPEEIAAFGDRHFGHIRQVVAEARESIDFLRRRMS